MTILCSLICFAAVFLFSGSVIVAAIHTVDLSLCRQVLDLFYQSFYSRLFYGAVGATVFFSAINVLQKKVSAATTHRAVRAYTPQGVISVSLTALEDMLKKFLTGYDELSDIRPFVYAKSRGKRNFVRVVLRASLDHNGNIQQIANHIQENVQMKIQDILGTDDEVKVDLDIRRITIPQAGIAKKFVPADTAKNVPYRNY